MARSEPLVLSTGLALEIASKTLVKARECGVVVLTLLLGTLPSVGRLVPAAMARATAGCAPAPGVRSSGSGSSRACSRNFANRLYVATVSAWPFQHRGLSRYSTGWYMGLVSMYAF